MPQVSVQQIDNLLICLTDDMIPLFYTYKVFAERKCILKDSIAINLQWVEPCHKSLMGPSSVTLCPVDCCY